jgi:uncharacterized phiE125 gp8 family phage protein
MLPVSISWASDSELPVSIGLVKAQLRVDHEEFDELLSDLHIPAAVEWAEGEMHRSILAKSHTWVLSDFPRTRDQRIRLPRGKTQSVESIQYDSGSGMITLRGVTSGSPAGADYLEDLRGDNGGFVLPLSDWPSVDVYSQTPVIITFTAGWLYGQVPADIKAAIIRKVADSLDVVSIQDVPAVVPAESIALSHWRLVRW